MLFYTLNSYIWSGIISNSWSKCLSIMAENMERGGAGLSARRRAKQMATTFHKPFRCLLMIQPTVLICAYFFDYWPYTVLLINLIVKMCDIGFIKSLLAAKLLWRRELKVDALHSRGSAYSVILKKIHCAFLCADSNNFNSILSELPRLTLLWLNLQSTIFVYTVYRDHTLTNEIAENTSRIY